MIIKNEKNFLNHFGKNLKKQRQLKGYSTRQLAVDAEISHSTLGRLESGLANPTLTTLFKLAYTLKIDLNTLTAGK